MSNLNNYKVYRLKKEYLRDLGFLPYDYIVAKQQGVKKDQYELIYECDVDWELDELYMRLNNDHPDDWLDKGLHSLSVGDIVVMNNVPYFCDSFGWNMLLGM